MTSTYAIDQLAEQRREVLIAETTNYWQTRSRRTERRPDTQRRTYSARRIAGQPRSAFRAWYSAGEL